MSVFSDMLKVYVHEKDVKVVYYLSMEFLMGRFFGNSLINLEMYDEVKEVLPGW